MSTALAAVDVSELYRPSSKEPPIIGVPEVQFYMVDGIGTPTDGPFLTGSTRGRSRVGDWDGAEGATC
jgi:hypothetical protein